MPGNLLKRIDLREAFWPFSFQAVLMLSKLFSEL
jgi:hypothetical protein